MIPASAALPEQRGALIAVRTLGTTAVVLAGIASLVANVAGAATLHAGAASWLVIATTGLLWGLGFLLPDREQGTVASIAALMLLYASPLLLPEAWTWLNFGVLSSSIAVSAAIALPPRRSVPLLAITLGLMSWYATSPTGVPVDMHLPTIGGWAAPLFNLSIAVGIVLWRAEWVRAARHSDAALERAIALHAQAQRAVAVSEARVSVARSLHETVLNTLVAIAAGTSDDSVAQLRQVCRDDLERARRESSEDAVLVQPPALPLPPALAQGMPAIVLLTGERRIRIAASIAMAFGILTVGVVVAALPAPLALLLPYLAFVGVIGVLVWWWRLQRTLAVAAFLLLAAMALLIVIVEQPPGAGDDAAIALDWLINAGAASMILPTLTVAAGAVVRVVFPWTLLLANIVAILLLPADARTGPVTSLVVASLFLGGMAGAAVWLFGHIGRQDARARALLADASDAEYARVHRAELLAAWAAVSRATQDLLAGIGSGRLDPRDAGVQRRAQTEATILRSHLRMARSPSSGMQASLERVLAAASDAATPVDLTIIVPSTARTGLPAAVERELIDLVARCSGSPMAIRLVGGTGADPEELIITTPLAAGLDFVDRCAREPGAAGWAAAVEEQTPDRARISLSCDAFAIVES